MKAHGDGVLDEGLAIRVGPKTGKIRVTTSRTSLRIGSDGKPKFAKKRLLDRPVRKVAGT